MEKDKVAASAKQLLYELAIDGDVQSAAKHLSDTIDESEAARPSVPEQGQGRQLMMVGEPVLRLKAKPITEGFQELSADMTAVMRAAGGIGLAAPQVGESLRYFILEIEDEFASFVNPEIVSAKGESWADEGCLSIPDIKLHIKRSAEVEVRAEGWKHTRVFDGLWARAIQHEIDHLDGILITDRALQQTLAALAASRSEAQPPQEKTCDRCGRFMTEITRHQLGGMRRHSVEVLCDKCKAGAPAAGSAERWKEFAQHKPGCISMEPSEMTEPIKRCNCGLEALLAN